MTDMFGPSVLSSPTLSKIPSEPLIISYVTELNNIGAKKNKDAFVDTGLSLLGKTIKKGILSIIGSGITLTNNEIKDIMKVIKSSENRGILLKKTTKKITSQEGGFINFLRPLMTAGLPLMNKFLMPLAKNVLLPFGLSARMSATDAAIQKKIYGSGHPLDLASCITALVISN